MRITSSKRAVDLPDTVLAAQENSPYTLLDPSISSLTPSPLPFGHLAPLADGSIVSPKPDYYEGARPEQLNRKIRTELGGYIVPSTNHCAPIVPNFFTQGKGPSGNMAVADRQAFPGKGTIDGEEYQGYGRI